MPTANAEGPGRNRAAASESSVDDTAMVSSPSPGAIGIRRRHAPSETIVRQKTHALHTGMRMSGWSVQANERVVLAAGPKIGYQKAVAYIVMAHTAMAYTAMAYIVMASIVMAYAAVAYTAMAYIVMA